MLDNAIDLHTDVDAKGTQYRGISLGTMGWHHLLALKKIRWESTEAVAFADELYEKISYLTVSASMELAKEKGAYPLFTGSDWHNGAYFDDRNYISKAWQKLRADISINGVRNGYMTAVTSNPTITNLTGSTVGIEPIIEKYYMEQHISETIPVIVPDLNQETFWFYKSGYFIDQKWTLMQNAARQRHIDQCISLNLYVQNTIQATELLELHMNAWKSGLKITNAIHLNTDFPRYLITVV
jgi:ribonucleoside-diphosphate reductase alpha chain